MTTSIDLLGTLKGKGAVRAERIAVVFERGEGSGNGDFAAVCGYDCPRK